MEPETEIHKQQELLPLDAAERLAVFRSGGRAYRHVFRRLTAADWDGWFSRIAAEFERKGSGISQLVDTESASLWLYGQAAMRAEGYTVSDGKLLADLPNWRDRIRLSHRLLAVNLLMKVTASPADGATIESAEEETVTLDAFWNEEGEAMKQYRGLVHRFRIPTAEQYLRFLKAKNRSTVVGGSRDGRTILMHSQPVLAKLYDDLIASVEGYGVAGGALAGADSIRREMDAFHKVAAVGQLFSTNAGEDEEEAA